MNYLIIGAGGTGGVIGWHMAKAGKDVTLIARGAHLQAMQEHGLTLQTMWNEHTQNIPVKATDMEHYSDHPDVILVCVKGYSLDETYDFIRKIATENTIVIPILNIYGTGAKMQEKLSEFQVLDGCIYVSANIKEPGVILQHGEILRIFFGPREPQENCPKFKQIQKDFCDSGIDGVLSEQVQRDALEKFSYVSPIGAAGLYFHATAGDFQKEGEERKLFCEMIREISDLAAAMGFPLESDRIAVNLQILSQLPPETTTSMQRDVMAHRPSEVDGLVYEVVRMAHKYQVSVPAYEKVAQKLQKEIMCENVENQRK